MIYSNPLFSKNVLTASLLCTAFYAASAEEGALLVKSPHNFVLVGVGAHSVTASIFLMLGYSEVAESAKKVYSSVKTNWTHLFGLFFLLASTYIHVSSLFHMHQKGAPLQKNDPSLVQYLNFCKFFIISTMLMEYFLFRLSSEKPVRRTENLLIH